MHKTKEQRRAEALLRQEERNKRSDIVQISLILRREAERGGGDSTKEKDRLFKRIYERNSKLSWKRNISLE